MTYADRSRPNPYVGPRAFRRGERLHGRERESMDLLHLLDAERIVLLYSRSGAGKTSLIEASLLPKLERRKLEVLPTMRVNLPLPSDAELPATTNPYVLSLLRCLEGKTGGEEETGRKISSEELVRLAGMTLKEYLDDHLETSKGKKLMLVFDQFEEILSIDPTNPTAKKEFFEQVGSALRDRRCWALFAMREDFVAGLDPYLRLMPTRLGTTYRLELLDEKAALLAIQRPAKQAGVEFTDSAALKLVDDLRQAWVQQPDGTMVEKKGVYVEPVQLQVVCYRLWEELPEGANQIMEKDVEAIGDVDSALADYYAERVALTAAKTGVSERAIREWFDRHLITQQGIRGQVLHRPEQKQSRGLDNRAIWDLVAAHLVRPEKRRGATWFELAHDRLIKPLRQNNEQWYRTDVSTSLTLRIYGWDRSAGVYPVEATLDDGSFFYGGEMHGDRMALLSAGHDWLPSEDIRFEELFTGPIRRAYDESIARAAVQTQNRLRLRLWLDDDAPELHAFPWERLYHTHRGETSPLSTSLFCSFSRFVGLPLADPIPVAERPIRLLIAISSPTDLVEFRQTMIDVAREVESLDHALHSLQQERRIQASVIPGYHGLPSELRVHLEDGGYEILEGVTGLPEILQLLPGYHAFHFLGHAHPIQEDKAVVFFEDEHGRSRPIESEELVTRLAAIPLPHLFILTTPNRAVSSPESEHPYATLAPKLVEAGVPAVVSFRGRMSIRAEQQLIHQFFTQLLQHGTVDRALNYARYTLYDDGEPDWASPLLYTRLQHGALFGTQLLTDDLGDADEHRDILIHIRPGDQEMGFYPVEVTLDDGSVFSGGELHVDRVASVVELLDVTEFGPDTLEALELRGIDLREFGLGLLDALFSGATRPAYDKALDRAETQTGGRLRFRLWIEETADELHVFPWELLHRIRGIHPIPLAAYMPTPFSRYTALETPERKPIPERPLRLLVAISSPKDQPRIYVEGAVEGFRQALAATQRPDLIRLTLMPGCAGLPRELKAQLEAEGHRVQEGATGLQEIRRLLPGYHLFHFLGHGLREQPGGRAGMLSEDGDESGSETLLFFEDAEGRSYIVGERDLLDLLKGIDLPHLMFLAAADTASLGPKLSRLGIPAVITMQGQVKEEESLTPSFYRHLCTHGVVDKALNQARLAVFEPDRTDWARPVLFMRLPQGKLFDPGLQVGE